MYASFSCLKDTWCKRIDKMFLTFLLKLEFLHGRVKQNQWWLLAGISKFHQRNNCCKGPAAAAWCGKLQGLIRHLRRKFSLNEIQRERERERERERQAHVRELARLEEASFTGETLGETCVSASDVRGIFPLRRTFDEQIRGCIRTLEQICETCISLRLVIWKETCSSIRRIRFKILRWFF